MTLALPVSVVRSLLVVVASVVLSVGCGDLPSRTLPSFALTNQSGRTVCTEEFRGQSVLISFIFTNCPDVCPLVTRQVAQVQAETRRAGRPSPMRFISITLDPATDTPAVLHRYAAQFGADTTTWDFLTGDPDEVGRVVQAMGVFVANDRGRLGHDSPVLFVDPAGRIVRRYTDTHDLSARILEDVRHIQATYNAAGRRGNS
jgi:protein SCO1/2